MYSFANRPDTQVVDEPMYAYYLKHTGIKYHPCTEEILKSLPQGIEEVKRQLIFQDLEMPIYFIKGMAHHYVDLDLSFLLKLENVLLIRDPYQLITSFSKVIETPTLDDIGLKREWEICEYLIAKDKSLIVLDSSDILTDPKFELEKLCSKLEIPFKEKMLSWEAGPIPEDGVWAKYWYNNVWKSEGFQKNIKSSNFLPDQLKDLYEESLIYYKLLRAI